MGRKGFTLIEVLVALAVAGVTVLLARGVFTAAADGGRALIAAREALDREANGRRWLKAAFLSLDVGSEDGSGPFEGRPDRMRFSSWQRTAGGWFERAELRLGQADGRLIATAPEAPVALAEGVAGVAFDYLLDPGADSKWVREWISPVSAPLAVRLRVAYRSERVDTLLYLIKERG